MRGELRKITGSQRLCLLLVLAVLCSGVLFALHATGDSGGYTVSGLRHAMAQEDPRRVRGASVAGAGAGRIHRRAQ